MTRFERLRTPSSVTCCACGRHLSVQDLDEFYGVVEECLYGEVHCSACREGHLLLCRECSCRYTTEGMCAACAAREYALAG